MSEDNANKHTAFVVMDIQSAALAYTGEDPAFLKRLSSAIATARKAGIRVIHVRFVSERDTQKSARTIASSPEVSQGASCHRQIWIFILPLPHSLARWS